MKQPTRFQLHLHTLQDVFGSPDFISSLALYSESRQEAPKLSTTPSSSSHLLLQLSSAADYFTTNRTLMQQVPPVDVDLGESMDSSLERPRLTTTVLDPFFLNIFPESLGPTALYILLLALGSYHLSGIIYTCLRRVSQSSGSEDKQSSKKIT